MRPITARSRPDHGPISSYFGTVVVATLDFVPMAVGILVVENNQTAEHLITRLCSHEVVHAKGSVVPWH